MQEGLKSNLFVTINTRNVTFVQDQKKFTIELLYNYWK